MYSDDFKSLKLSGNSSVELNKLIGGLKKSDIDNQKLLSVFEKIDVDKNGIIDQGEMSGFLNGILRAAKDDSLSVKEAQEYYNALGLEGSNNGTIESFLKHLENFGDTIEETKDISLEDGSQLISIKYKPDDNGNVVSMLYRKDNGNIVEHSVVTKKNLKTTTNYDESGLNITKSVVKFKGLVLISDNLGRLLKQDQENKITEYQYDNETVVPRKIIERFVDGKQILFQDGKKITILKDGTKTEEDDNHTRLDSSDTENTLSVSLEPENIEKNIDKSNGQNSSAKKVATTLQKMIYSAPSTGNSTELKNYIKQNVTSNNVDWVLYEYKVLTNSDLFSDLEKRLKYCDNARTLIKRHLANVQYSKYGVDLDFKNQHSVVKNKYHSGYAYSVVQNGTIIEITNKITKESKTIDLDILLKNYPNARERAQLIKILQSLPGEVLMDIAVETESFIPLKNTTEVISLSNGAQCSAAGYYDGSTDTIHVNPSNGTLTLVHELGHAVDYNGIFINSSSVLIDLNFKKIFNEEMRAYISAGNRRYIYNSSNSGNLSNYATANEIEMFAECYTLLMMGKCNSQSVIEKYFPKTLAYINKKISKIRHKWECSRHN